MKIIHLIYLLIFVVASANNGAVAQSDFQSDNITSDWQLIKESNGVSLYTRKQLCDLVGVKKPLEYVMVKLVNKSSSEHKVEFQLGLFFDDGCRGCEKNPETYKAITIPSNSTMEGDCTFSHSDLTFLIRNPNLSDGGILKKTELLELIVF